MLPRIRNRQLIDKVGLRTLRNNIKRDLDASDVDNIKTALMFRLERQLKKPIERLTAWDGRDAREIANELGVSESCICRWRERFGIRVPNVQSRERK